MTDRTKPVIPQAKIKEEPQDNGYEAAPAKPPEPPTGDNDSSRQSDRCSICWIDPPTNAVKVDCNHIFCFLCIKSAASFTKKCPLCRADITTDFDVGQFELVGTVKLPNPNRDGTFWFYGGRKGWWMYDADTSSELENARQMGWKKVQRLIAGQVYVMNIAKGKQYQKGLKERSRSICCSRLDQLDGSILGLAGLRDQATLSEIKMLKRRMELNRLNGSLDIKVEPGYESDDDENEEMRF